MLRTYSSKEHLEQLNVAVKIENLTVEYNGRAILFNINLDIPSGVLMAVLGPNNSGKTTLLKTIAGIDKPSAGNVYIYSRPTHTLKNDVAYVPARNFVNWDFPHQIQKTRCLLVRLLKEWGLILSARKAYAIYQGEKNTEH